MLSLRLRYCATPGYRSYPPAPTSSRRGFLRLHEQRPDKEWSLTDCISFVVMHDRGHHTRALSHDQQYEQAGFEAVLRRAPRGASHLLNSEEVQGKLEAG